MADKGKKVYDGNAQQTKLQMAARRRIDTRREGGTRSQQTREGGKAQLAPNNGRPAGSMIKPNPRNGFVNTFNVENFKKRRRA